MNAAYACPSQRLLEVQSTPSLDDFSASIPRVRRTRKYVQVITFESATSFHGRCCGTSPSAHSTRRPTSSARAHGFSVRGSECVGPPCSVQHGGPSCFPSTYLRTAPRLHDAPITQKGTSCVQYDAETAQLATTSPDETVLRLLWSVTPPQLLTKLIATPQDAERILARLKEEQRLLELCGDG